MTCAVLKMAYLAICLLQDGTLHTMEWQLALKMELMEHTAFLMMAYFAKMEIQ